MSVSILLFALLASQPHQTAPLLRVSTAKSLNEFGACFVRAQDQASHPWAFVPTETGGTFTDAGANGVAAPYWLRISETRPLNEIRLFAAGGPTAPKLLLEAVDRCR